jgi:predicted ArsR family transcriptional regulator
MVKLPIIKDMEGMTITEMAKKLGLPQRTVERRIQRAGIKPMSREAIYPNDTLKKISDVKMGRPKKAAAPEKPIGNARKAKK